MPANCPGLAALNGPLAGCLIEPATPKHLSVAANGVEPW
jgi:hypothetical protein